LIRSISQRPVGDTRDAAAALEALAAQLRAERHNAFADRADNL